MNDDKIASMIKSVEKLQQKIEELQRKVQELQRLLQRPWWTRWRRAP